MASAKATGPVKVYGASDDLIELEGGVHDEIGADSGFVIVGGEKGGIRIFAEYAPVPGRATWRLSVEPVDVDVPCPWPVHVGAEQYTATVTVDCPAGTSVEYGRGVPEMDKRRREREREEQRRREEEARKARDAALAKLTADDLRALGIRA